MYVRAFGHCADIMHLSTHQRTCRDEQRAFISFLSNLWRSYTGAARQRIRETRIRNAAAIVAKLGDELKAGERVNSRCGTFDISNFKGTPAQASGLLA